MSEIVVTGTPVWECCNHYNDTLRSRYTELEAEEIKLREEIKESEKRLAEIREEYKVLNKQEVYNVLDYVRCYTRSNNISNADVDMLLCHCMNKLNGNINSVFLKFDDPVDNKVDLCKAEQ